MSKHRSSKSSSSNMGDYTEDDEFQHQLNKQVSASYWLIFITILSIIPEITYNLLNSITIHKGPDFDVRCEVPLLEDLGYTFEELKNITQSNSPENKCMYYDYNYESFEDMQYPEVLLYVKTLIKPDLQPCKNVVYDRNTGYTTMYKEFTLYCYPFTEKVILIAHVFGTILGYIMFSPLGDIFGRKPILIFGLNNLVLVIFGLIFFTNTELFITFRFLSGLAFAPIKTSQEALIIELSSPYNRPWRLFVVNSLSSGLSYTLILFWSTVIKNWRYMQCFCSIGILTFPLIQWYMPESPSWIYGYKKKLRAWTLLKSLKDPVSHNEALQVYSNDKQSDNTYYRLVVEFKSLRQKKLWVHIIFVGMAGGIYMKNFIDYFQDTIFKDKSLIYLYFLGLSDLISFSTSIVLLIVTSRKMTLFLCQLLIIVLCLTISQFEASSWTAYVLYYFLDCFTSIVFQVAKLHGVEHAPSTHRCSVLGLFGASASIFRIVSFLLIYNLQMNIYFIVMGILSSISFVICWFLEPDHLNDIYNNFDN